MKKMSNVTFKYCGLDKEHNFLQAPMCECGCGQYANMVLENDEDVYGFMYSMLDEFECEHCAIFTLKDNGHILMGIKLDGEIKCYEAVSNAPEEEIWKDAFKDIQEEFEFHCYGLLEQVDKDLYRIIMD